MQTILSSLHVEYSWSLRGCDPNISGLRALVTVGRIDAGGKSIGLLVRLLRCARTGTNRSIRSKHRQLVNCKTYR